MIDILGWIIVICNVIFLLTILVAEKSDPSKIAAWALIFICLPFVGFILYLFIGQTFYSRHTFRLKGIKEDELQMWADLDKEYVEKETNEEYKKTAMTVYNFGGYGYTSNNDVKLYTLGQDKFDDLYRDLRAAKNFIHLEYYIIRNDELGNELMTILTEKVKEGVQVRLLTDDFGIGKGPKKAIKEFRKAGGEFAVFHKVIYLMLSPKKNNRNHRKIAVIDGKVCYCGGFNIGDEYLGKGPLGFWRDSAVRMVGDSVFTFDLRFLTDWEYATKTTEKDYGVYYRKEMSEHKGDNRVLVVSGGPDSSDYNPVRMEYLELINRARKSVYIHSPYFIPDDSLQDALSMAAARGVDVKVIIPDKPDHMFVFWNNIRCSYSVMNNGVKVFMYNRGFVHSKTMVVDGEYCSVGSANFDDRSLVLNFETNAMIFSKDVGRSMDEAFAEDLKYCTEYHTEDYEKLTIGKSVSVEVSRQFGNLA